MFITVRLVLSILWISWVSVYVSWPNVTWQYFLVLVKEFYKEQVLPVGLVDDGSCKTG